MNGDLFLEDVVREFGSLRSLAERAVAQIDDAALLRERQGGGNSIAILIRHMAGNLRSRWRDFLTTDGEKEDRHRDGEFVLPEGYDRAALMADWDRAWEILFDTLASLGPDDLGKTITIRGEPHRVSQAILRQIPHYAYHVGQIVLLAREDAGGAWQSLSIPKGASESFRQAPTPYLEKS